MQINNNFQKNANISMVAQLLWKSPGISRVEIARQLDLYRSTVSNIINTLIDNGVVFEEKEGESMPQGGRKPICLGLNDKFGCVLGIEVQPSGFHAVVLNIVGNVIFSKSGGIPELPFDDALRGILDSLMNEILHLDIPLLGICFALPGIIDSSKGIIIKSDPFHLVNHSCTANLSTRYGVPVFMENDANCLAWLELANNRGENKRNFICLNAEFHYKDSVFGEQTGMGVGLGIALGGSVFSGSKFAAGEFFSVSWREGVEGQTGLSPEIMRTLETDKKSFTAWIVDLFSSLVPVVSVLDPEVVFAHGDIARHASFVNEILDSEVPQFRSLLSRSDCELIFGDGSDLSVASGAAQMFYLQLFTLPVCSDRDPGTMIEWDAVFSLSTRKVAKN